MIKQAASTLAPICCNSLTAALGGAAGRDQVIDQDHPLALLDGVLVHLPLVDAVFERVADAHALEWQLAFLADGDETGRYLMRHRAAQYEAARLDAGDLLVDLAAGPGLHQFVHRTAKRARVAEQRVVISRNMIPGLG